MASASAENKLVLVNKMIDDHIYQLHVKKHEHALKEVKAVATTMNIIMCQWKS